MAKKITTESYIKLYKEVFGSENGQKVLMDICKRGGVLGRKALSKENPAYELAFNEGQRALALDILSKVEYDLNKLLELRANYSLEVQDDR